MKVVTDLQIHSKYARAVSQEMVIPKIWDWARRKGIDLVATGDWTHPLWMREIKANLEEMGNGLLKLRNQISNIKTEEKGPYFLLATEVSSIYSQGGKLRRVHTLIWVPSIESADKINKELIQRGANLLSDGRPIIGLSSIQVAELVFSIDESALIIPAHAWTPWFSLYGSESGFDSISECFGNYAKYIYAIETGLSSDPAMNWRIKELDERSIVSFSDAHSGPKLGREATVFDIDRISFGNIRKAIIGNQGHQLNGESPNGKSVNNLNKIAYTIEFYPEEGKYHYTGHRNCQVKQNPEETRKNGTMCPVCGRKLTVGVMHRVDELSGRSTAELKVKKRNLEGTKLQAISSELFPNRPPYVMMVPLQEILSESIGGLPTSQSVQNEYKKLVDNFEGEFNTLLSVSTDDIARVSGPRVSEGISKVRSGNITVDPGYDGVFGVVKIWNEDTQQEKEKQRSQLSLF